MKNPMEVLKSKEQEVQKVKREIEALKLAVRLLNEDSSNVSEPKQELRGVIEMP